MNEVAGYEQASFYLVVVDVVSSFPFLFLSYCSFNSSIHWSSSSSHKNSQTFLIRIEIFWVRRSFFFYILKSWRHLFIEMKKCARSSSNSKLQQPKKNDILFSFLCSRVWIFCDEVFFEKKNLLRNLLWNVGRVNDSVLKISLNF